MKIITPQIFHLASTTMDTEGHVGFLRSQEATDWRTDAPGGSEYLIEMAGRMCYKSWKPDLNPNVTKVREGNKQYIGNILKQKHGSVLEHGHDTFAFVNVSRVFTHEVVRHRLANYSQESLRFVRLTELKAYYPQILVDAPEDIVYKIENIFDETFKTLEDIQRKLAEVLDLDNMDFSDKKKFTSAMRRLAPIGLATNIIMTTNHRNWRHIIQMRTSRHAEEEIRLVFGDVADWMYYHYPAIYQDMHQEYVDGLSEYTFENEKV